MDGLKTFIVTYGLKLTFINELKDNGLHNCIIGKKLGSVENMGCYRKEFLAVRHAIAI